MTRLYECMFLLDNDVVRTGWSEAKASVAAVIAKHGGTFVTARRWDERRLMYPIRHKNRATYLLSYCNLAPPEIEALRDELDLSELVMRYLILATDEVPAEEMALGLAEQDPEFVLPEPPADDAVDEVPEAEAEGGEAAKADEAKAEGKADESQADEGKADAPASTEEKTETVSEEG